MLQGESHVSQSQILLLCNSICHMSVRKKSKKKKQYNSSHCELGAIYTYSVHVKGFIRYIKQGAVDPQQTRGTLLYISKFKFSHNINNQSAKFVIAPQKLNYRI